MNPWEALVYTLVTSCVLYAAAIVALLVYYAGERREARRREGSFDKHAEDAIRMVREPK